MARQPCQTNLTPQTFLRSRSLPLFLRLLVPISFQIIPVKLNQPSSYLGVHELLVLVLALQPRLASFHLTFRRRRRLRCFHPC
ncbi:hypothetical protein V1514DRAFT_325228 [Lipomyces japonicus]|uniref:uncharacterized protein n=1 Tax=Lipomyces japonicus TaxID=56871 RepID=UPI0034CF2D83